LSQKSQSRRPLHRPTGRFHGDLPRRTRAGEPSRISSRPGLVFGRPSHQGAAGVQSWSREGLGLRCSAGRRRPGADAHRTLQKHQGLAQTAPGGRGGQSRRRDLPHHRQPRQPQESPDSGVVGGSSAGRAGVHPQRRGLAQLAGGVVANVPSGGFGRSALRRLRGDRDGYEGSRQTAQSSGETVGMGTRTQTAEASETHFCVTSLRNGAVETQPP
jgi:hypothetical protein